METINFDSNKTKVLLIGVTKFYDDSTIHAIPNVKRNITLLKKAFLSNNVLNITEEDLTVSFNETKTEIERKLIQASRDAENHNYTLLVYYAGHGLISTQDFRLYLTASNTTNDYLETDGINISRFKEIIESSRAGRKIVILDACHSGAIHNALNTVSSQIQSELNKFEGTYVITSASEDNPALYPADNPKLPTYFTGKFIEILEKGIENNNQYISIRDIFEEIENSFRKQGNIPLPQQSAFQNADKIIFAQNNSFTEIIENTVIDNINFQPVTFSNLNERPKSKKFNFLNKITAFMF